MSPPHELAVGSYGPEAEAWLEDAAGIVLRWWQRLVLYRLLEHDSQGALVWLDGMVSTARQVGKSVGLRGLALWRLHQAQRWGEAQVIMHTGKDLAVCREIQNAARAWARHRGYPTLQGNGREQVGMPDPEDESRWMVRGQNSVYGYGVGLALIDEAWAVHPRVVEEGLEPTLAERVSPQLLLFSTAHRRATALVPLRRVTVLERWGTGSSFLAEWSAPAGSAISDPAAWKLASPHWSAGRQRLLEAKLARVQSGVSEDPDEDDPQESFRSQWLNQWPLRRLVATTAAEPLVDPDEWLARADIHQGIPAGALVIAVDDWFGLGAAGAGAARLADGRVLVWGAVFRSRAEALSWALYTAQGHEGTQVVLAGALKGALEPDWCPPELSPSWAGAAETRVALPALRALVQQGRLVHPGDPGMTGQLTACKVTPRDGGLAIAHRGVRHDLVRAVAWASTVAAHQATPVPFFVY